jgi:DNA-binding LacI/PurR family transcriptional regulator
MRNWLATGEVPEAIFVVNDPAAIGAMRALDEAGLQAGKDVALVGANIHYGAMLRVPLTTVSCQGEMGRCVARLLIDNRREVDGYSGTACGPGTRTSRSRFMWSQNQQAQSQNRVELAG